VFIVFCGIIYIYICAFFHIKAGDLMNPILNKIQGYIAYAARETAALGRNLVKKWFSRKEFFTLMIIPHASVKNVKSVKFPRWIVSIFMMFNTVAFIVVCVFGISYYTLNIKLQNKKVEYESLQAMKEHDEKQLSEYKSNESEIKEKIQVLKDLEIKLKDIIESKGGKPQSSTAGVTKFASRGMSTGILSEALSKPTADTDSLELNNVKDISTAVDELAIQVDNDIKDLNEAIDKAEKQMKAMMAKPSVLPTYGSISSTYGWRRNPFGSGSEFHNGLDIANSYGTPIRASGDGVVTISGWDGGYGRLVKINHGNGYESLYGHNSRIAVNVGESVKRGQVIAYMGSTGYSTGTHCHFEVRLYGNPINPYNVK